MLYTSAFPTLGTSHRVSAWNSLCSLIDQALETDLPEVRYLIWSSNAWNRALDLYIYHAQTARPKSARQLLVSLTNSLKKAPPEAQADLKRFAIHRLVHCLLDSEDPFRAKASAQLLAHLLNKDGVNIEKVISHFSEGQLADAAATFEINTAAFLELLFGWLGKGDFGSTIAQLIAAVLDKVPAQDVSGRPIWVLPLEQAYQRKSGNIDDLRAHVFPMLFKRSYTDFAAFLQSQGLDKLMQSDDPASTPAEGGEELLFAALQTGKELGMLLETDENKLSYSSPSVLVPLRLISKLLLHRSRPARLTGLSLLINSPSITRPLSAEALNLARRSFGIFFADVDADFRSEVFGAFSRLVDRIRAGTASLARQKAQEKLQDPEVPASDIVITSHQDFVKRMARFLTWELRPTASYQRHISALKCISILARSGLDPHVPLEFYSKSAQGETKWSFHLSVLTKDLQRLLLDNLLDPFEDVRASASAILGYYCSTAATSGLLQQAQLASTLERAEAMMLATGRADQADGVAHLYSICYRRCGPEESSPAEFWSSRSAFCMSLVKKLEEMLARAKRNLGDAVEHYPMHGLLTSLRYVLQQDQASVGTELRLQLFGYLLEVWDVVRPILCNDAPEGYIPEELGDSPESTKESLSYCWRALKEASLLLSSLISTESVGDNTETLQQKSRLCFTQLAELRHRGAFSTVAQTWQSACVRCKDLRNPAGILMLEAWYSDVLEILRNNVTINTRRSAGLPSLLCGILVADKSGMLLSRAFVDLENIARQDVDAISAEEGSLAQVHAMNCLKDMLKNTRLGEQTQHYVPAALQLAADALRSEVWGVRNCGLMLFRAVIDRLLGTNESHFEDDLVLQKRISAEQHPALLDVILGLLPSPAASAQDRSVRYESVFPTLQLLQHTRIPPGRLEDTRAAVKVLTASPSWHVRDKAARALASLVDRGEILLQLTNLTATETKSQNDLHGVLLTAKYITIQARRARLKTIDDDHTGNQQDHFAFIQTIASMYHATPAVVIKAACVDLLRELCAYLSQSGGSDQRGIHQQLLFAFVDTKLHEQGAAAVYSNVLTQCLYDTTDAVLRQAWARYAAHHIATYKLGTTKEADSFTLALFELARRDEDAASYFLAISNWTNMQNGGNVALVIDLCTKVLASEGLSIALKCHAQRTLLVLLSKHSTLTPDLKDILQHATADHLYLGRQDCNQQYVDHLLELQAVSFESASADQDPSDEFDALIPWAGSCMSAINGTGVHTREAAAEALQKLDFTWAVLANRQPLAAAFQGLCCAVYDLLNDDDEEIRLLAAGITRRILSRATTQKDVDLEPIVAGQKLLSLYTSRAGASPECLLMALDRAYGGPADDTVTPVAEQLAKLSHSDTALFAQEKQNLYIDEAQEVRIWSQVTGKLLAEQPSDSAVEPVEVFSRWISNGLEALAARAEAKHDGALGWSTTEEVFALGLRVIHGSEIVLQMKSRGVLVPALETKLFACSKAFEKSGVNCLWKREIERVLSDAVMSKLGKMNASTVKRYQVGA